jgi:PAS domain S-box-containing protein
MNAPQPQASPVEQPLVLTVDDDAMVRLLTRESLTQDGFRVCDAENGREALEVFTAELPDIVLMDVMMPEMDGFEALEKLRRLPGGATTPVLMVTGLDDVESIHRAYEVGATDFITKPINWVILGHRLRYMLRASRALGELRASQERLAEAQRIARLGNWEWDLTRDRVSVSQQTLRIFGLEGVSGSVPARVLASRVHPADRKAVDQAISLALAEGHPLSLDYRIRRPDGAVRVVQVRSERTALPETMADGAGERLTGTVQDITEQRQAEERIRSLAYFDSLTGLPNRALLQERLERAVQQAGDQHRPLALLVLDLDQFKRINDTLGHSSGDQILKETAERLLACVHGVERVGRVGPATLDDRAVTVARLGGDEFTLLLTAIGRAEDAARLAQGILAAMARPFRLRGQEVVVTASIGVSTYPDDGTDVESLLKNADTALYHAKDRGRNDFQYYSASMNQRTLERLLLESDLRKALERDQIRVYYQPKVDIPTGALVGMEALVRWQHPTRGLISPGLFIPVAEESGLIEAIGSHVLRTACADTRAWLAAGNSGLSVAVNLSARQFRNRGLVEEVAAALGETGLHPGALELEITESVVMDDAESAVRTLHALKAMGMRLAVDDFGTGYSSFGYIKRFSLDTLKIDRSFVDHVHESGDDAAIAGAIIAMAHHLKLQVVAEGVETAEQLTFLHDNDCDLAQGYFFAKPLPHTEFEAMLRAQAQQPAGSAYRHAAWRKPAYSSG